MVHTVGIAGSNGYIGFPTTKLLVEEANKGRINLVIFHRPESKVDPTFTGVNVEARALDFGDEPAKIEAAVKGINTFISVIAATAVQSEVGLVEALSKSSDIVAFVPTLMSAPWTKADEQDPRFGPLLAMFHASTEAAKAKGLGIAMIFTGLFENHLLEYGIISSPIKGNEILLNKAHMKNRLPITTRDHLAAVLAQIGIAEPASVVGKEYSVVSFWPSGQELVDLYSKLNGSPAQIKDFTPEEHEAMKTDSSGFGAIKTGYMDHWESGKWDYEGGESGTRSLDKSYRGPSLEENARQYL